MCQRMFSQERAPQTGKVFEESKTGKKPVRDRCQDPSSQGQPLESSTWTATNDPKAALAGENVYRPRGARRSRRWTAAVYSLAGFLALTLLGMVRLPRGTVGTVWAEDGGTFLRDNLQEHNLLDIFAPYGGYVHVLPR